MLAGFRISKAGFLQRLDSNAKAVAPTPFSGPSATARSPAKSHGVLYKACCLCGGLDWRLLARVQGTGCKVQGLEVCRDMQVQG